jgi:hypothetical protein
MIELSIKRLSQTNEWKVPWVEDGVYKEGPSYYSDDKEDAKGALVDTWRRLVAANIPVVVRGRIALDAMEEAGLEGSNAEPQIEWSKKHETPRFGGAPPEGKNLF